MAATMTPRRARGGRVVAGQLVVVGGGEVSGYCSASDWACDVRWGSRTVHSGWETAHLAGEATWGIGGWGSGYGYVGYAAAVAFCWGLLLRGRAGCALRATFVREIVLYSRIQKCIKQF